MKCFWSPTYPKIPVASDVFLSKSEGFRKKNLLVATGIIGWGALPGYNHIPCGENMNYTTPAMFVGFKSHHPVKATCFAACEEPH